jgi:hypothetical protein
MTSGSSMLAMTRSRPPLRAPLDLDGEENWPEADLEIGVNIRSRTSPRLSE